MDETDHLRARYRWQEALDLEARTSIVCADVVRELRSLLDDELGGGRAADAGRPADSAFAMGLLTAFGTPQDVADRYRPAGFTIIRPSNAPRFTWIALGGIALNALACGR